jgi:hypothetical protein
MNKLLRQVQLEHLKDFNEADPCMAALLLL